MGARREFQASRVRQVAAAAGQVTHLLPVLAAQAMLGAAAAVAALWPVRLVLVGPRSMAAAAVAVAQMMLPAVARGVLRLHMAALAARAGMIRLPVLLVLSLLAVAAVAAAVQPRAIVVQAQRVR